MAVNSFYCNRCKNRTIHYEISGREYDAITEQSGRMESLFFRGFIEISGLGLVQRRLLGLHFWKCSQCGDASLRDLKGEE